MCSLLCVIDMRMFFTDRKDPREREDWTVIDICGGGGAHEEEGSGGVEEQRFDDCERRDA